MANSANWQVKWPSKEYREEYSNWRVETSVHIRMLFNPQELVIFYMYYGLGWGRRKIKKCTGFSEFTLKKVLHRFKDYSKNASTLSDKEITIQQSYADNLDSLI